MTDVCEHYGNFSWESFRDTEEIGADTPVEKTFDDSILFMNMVERVTDRDFCMTSEVVLASTNRDRHGDQLTKELLESIREQVLSDPDKRILRHNHNIDIENGEILDIYLEEEKGIWLLKGEVGIFKEREEVKDQILSGELSGLSISFRQYEKTTAEEWEDKDVTTKIYVDGKLRKDLRSTLEKFDSEFAVIIQKSAIAPAVFEFAVENKELLSRLLTASFIWWMSKRSDGIEIEAPAVEFPKIDVTIDFSLIEDKVEIGDVKDFDEISQSIQEDVKESILDELEDD